MQYLNNLLLPELAKTQEIINRLQYRGELYFLSLLLPEKY